MSDPIVSIDSSEIHEGKLEELRSAMKELVEFVDTNEAQPFLYNVYLNEQKSLMTVVQVHPDSASMEFHMNVAGPAFPRLSEFVTLSRIDIYGNPTNKLLEQMRQKARTLGDATLVVHNCMQGSLASESPESRSSELPSERLCASMRIAIGTGQGVQWTGTRSSFV